MLQSLYQVRLQGILQKSRHSALCVQIAGRYRLLLGSLSVCIAYDDSRQSLLQVRDVACQTQNCHNLGCYGDVIAILSGHSIGLSAKAIHYVTKLTVIHVHASSPGDLSRIDVQSVALENMVVNHGCQQVVGCSDCMEIAGEMKVDILHGHYLRVSAAGSSALYTKYRSQRRLAESYHNLLANLLKSICQSYRCGSLSFSCGSRVDSSNQNQLAVLSIGLLQKIVVDLCFVLSVLLQILVVNSRLLRNLRNRQHLCLLCNFNVRFESHFETSPFIVRVRAYRTAIFSVDNLTIPCGLVSSTMCSLYCTVKHPTIIQTVGCLIFFSQSDFTHFLQGNYGSIQGNTFDFLHIYDAFPENPVFSGIPFASFLPHFLSSDLASIFQIQHGALQNRGFIRQSVKFDDRGYRRNRNFFHLLASRLVFPGEIPCSHGFPVAYRKTQLPGSGKQFLLRAVASQREDGVFQLIFTDIVKLITAAGDVLAGILRVIPRILQIRLSLSAIDGFLLTGLYLLYRAEPPNVTEGEKFKKRSQDTAFAFPAPPVSGIYF